ncbi:DNA polymerase Y family protein [Ramlibacter sp.]|uniref:DNA polymerase Y family protein n=1 Tax=Ramlibacter sp. TaxID=1917967 RepID=UPI0035AF7D7C
MHWIALSPSSDEDRTAWGWRALQFTPRVAAVEEALLLEVGASLRLFGGRQRLLRRLLKAAAVIPWAEGPTSLVALALLRLRQAGEPVPTRLPDDLPLPTLSAARAALPTLARVGCTTWGELRALPRAGVARRFGAALLQALDAAWGERPERYEWLALPQAFNQSLELPALATSAPDLLAGAQRLLTLLAAWLAARNRGVLAIAFEWQLDLRRLDGRPLPPSEQLVIRTAQPTQAMRHLRRLAAEQFARTTLAAPAHTLRLRTLETVPWGGLTTSLLPEEQRSGERLHELVERLSVRLGEANVLVAEPRQDWRPECMQAWRPARQGLADGVAARAQDAADALYPPWLLREPVPLQVKADKPFYLGPLALLTRARRLEAAWWDTAQAGPVLRDYFIARSEAAGLLWIFRERLAPEQQAAARWFLHGLYA